MKKPIQMKMEGMKLLRKKLIKVAIVGEYMFQNIGLVKKLEWFLSND